MPTPACGPTAPDDGQHRDFWDLLCPQLGDVPGPLLSDSEVSRLGPPCSTPASGRPSQTCFPALKASRKILGNSLNAQCFQNKPRAAEQEGDTGAPGACLLDPGEKPLLQPPPLGSGTSTHMLTLKKNTYQIIIQMTVPKY